MEMEATYMPANISIQGSDYLEKKMVRRCILRTISGIKLVGADWEPNLEGLWLLSTEPCKKVEGTFNYKRRSKRRYRTFTNWNFVLPEQYNQTVYPY